MDMRYATISQALSYTGVVVKLRALASCQWAELATLALSNTDVASVISYNSHAR